MKRTTRRRVHELLKSFAQASFKHYDVETLKRAYPFHRLFFDEAGLLAFKQERSVVTRMGQSLYPKLAQLIASDRYGKVELEKVFIGQLGATALGAIDRIVRELRVRQRQPNHAGEVSEVLKALEAGGGTREVKVTADLYIGDFDEGPLFMEIKTPVPNLDICAETKNKLLTFIALLHGQNPQGYLAFPYNPFVTRAEYKHGYTKQVMDLNTEVLIAEEFWDKIGGSGTFSQLLSIVEQVGDELRQGRI